jgi:hypothetical protein
MKKDLRDRWVAALRSGEYLQGHGRLRNTPDMATVEMCCLGVLCDVVDPHAWTFSDEWTHEEEGIVHTLEDALDATALARVGLDEEIQKELIHLNDDEHASFTEIASVIERQVPVE